MHLVKLREILKYKYIDTEEVVNLEKVFAD